MTIRETSSDFTSVIAALQAQVAVLQAQNVKQELQLDGLYSQFAAAERRRQASRLRWALPLLGLLGMLVLSVLFLPTTRAQTPDLRSAKTAAQPNRDQSDATIATAADEKRASPNTTGQPMLIGAANAPTAFQDKTVLYNTSGSDLMQLTFLVNNYSDSDPSASLLAGRSIAILGNTSGGETLSSFHVGVMGVSDKDQGVYGYAAGSNGQGVYGYAAGSSGIGLTGKAPSTTNGWGVFGEGGKYGGVFSGWSAPLRLMEHLIDGPPTTGTHYRGELYVSGDGHLYFCRTDGTPGTWVRLDLDTVFVPLVQK